MKWVLDTNVLVSALLKKDSLPYRIYLKATEGAFDCVVSDVILLEYQEVFQRPKLKIKPAEAKGVLDFFRGGVLVKGEQSSKRLPDLLDQAFLDAAVEAGALVIVTGNTKDFPSIICDPIKVFTPKEAMEFLQKK